MLCWFCSYCPPWYKRKCRLCKGVCVYVHVCVLDTTAITKLTANSTFQRNWVRKCPGPVNVRNKYQVQNPGLTKKELKVVQQRSRQHNFPCSSLISKVLVLLESTLAHHCTSHSRITYRGASKRCFSGSQVRRGEKVVRNRTEKMLGGGWIYHNSTRSAAGARVSRGCSACVWVGAEGRRLLCPLASHEP